MAQVQVPPQPPVLEPNVTVANGAPGAAPGAPGANAYPMTSLYVGDLEQNVTDSQLYDLFSQLGAVVSVRVCRDISTHKSLGYAYVNFSNQVEAARALEVLNFNPINGKPIRMMYSNRDPSSRKNGAANIFIKNLDKAIDNKALHDTFCAFGKILSCKIATDANGQSKGYGFVQYDQEEAAQTAINKLNGMLLNDKQVFVGPFLRKQDRENSVNKAEFNNVFVKNLSESTIEDDLKVIFGEFGTITSTVIMREGDGKSKCFGFVNFENPDSAAQAVESLNGKKFEDKEWYVGKAQKKSEREQELKGKFEQNIKETVDKYQGLNLYLKNLDDSIGDEKLRELFSDFGTITSCKVMRDLNGISRGSGFVAFSTSEEASRALAEMNGKMVANKPLYVALSQRKEDRRAKLQAQFSQMQPVNVQPAFAPRMPIYGPGGPGLGQQLFYGQAPPTLIPPQRLLEMKKDSIYLNASTLSKFLKKQVFWVHNHLLFQLKQKKNIADSEDSLFEYVRRVIQFMGKRCYSHWQKKNIADSEDSLFEYVRRVSQYMGKRCYSHWQDACLIMKYLKESPGKVYFQNNGHLDLCSYSDADYA